MPTGFEDAPEESSLLTPEMAERVVERFAERQAAHQREEAAERERLASMAKVQELADLLGTTPEDVMALAKEVREKPDASRSKLPPTPVWVPHEKPRWPLHLAYLALLALVGGWGMVVGNRPPDQTPVPGSVANASPALAPTIRFDPYLKGYVRNPGMPTPWNRNQEVLLDERIVPPPPGFRLKLVTPVSEKSVAGLPGKTNDSAASAEALRKSVRTLLAYEESLAKIEGSLPIVDYANAPYTQSSANFQGEPTLLGWHVVEVSTNRGQYRALLPDRRYATDIKAYEKALKGRLEILSDAKLFPSQPPAMLRTGALKISPVPALPKGTTLMVWNGRQTVWARGAEKGDPAQADQAVVNAMQTSQRLLAGTMGEKEDHLQVMLMYPVGEYQNSWPLPTAKDYQTGGALIRQKEELEDLARTAADSVKPAPPRPPGMIRIGPL